MSTTETESGTSQYVPFTPFQESYAFEAEPVSSSLAERAGSGPVVSPFVSEYGGVTTLTPEASELQELLSELYDQEFDETLADLAHEAWEAVTQRAEPFGEAGMGESEEQFLQEWSRPVRQSAEAMLENISQAAAEHDLASMSEAEIDRFFETFEPRETGLEQHFENFLGGLWNKVKSIAKKAVSVVGKGLTMIPGISGLIGKLKALVKPLLDRVLRTAIDKLPATLRPLARQLAQRVLGTSGETEDEQFSAAPTSPDLSAVQQQFDLEAATMMFARDELEQELLLNEAVAETEREPGPAVAQLHEARARFVDQLESGADPEQAMEQFIPAIMAVLPIARTVIGFIGRGRVIETLAGFLTPLVSQYVPRDAATKLSSAIIDAGMRMLSLETPGEVEQAAPRVAFETIAQTVEDTVRRVGELNEGVFEEPELLEAGDHRGLPRGGRRELPSASDRARAPRGFAARDVGRDAASWPAQVLQEVHARLRRRDHAPDRGYAHDLSRREADSVSQGPAGRHTAGSRARPSLSGNRRDDVAPHCAPRARRGRARTRPSPWSAVSST